MTRNLKAMGLALFCVFALGALGAQSASAVVEHTFTSGAPADKGTVLTGTTEGTEAFKLTNSETRCTDVTYRGTMEGNASNHVAVVPIFTEGNCEIPGIGGVTITNTGCTYTFGSDTFENTAHFPAGQLHANVSMRCDHPAPDGGDIFIDGPGCDITVETTHSGAVKVNHDLPGIRYTVISAAEDGGSSTKASITVDATVRTIKATTAGGLCFLVGLGNPGTHSNGTFNGTAKVTCYEDTGTRNPHTETMSEGPQVDCGLSTP